MAWRIRQQLGVDADVYERRRDILLETSAGTSNRFHDGYQYARSGATASSRREHHRQFRNVHGACVMPSANYDGVADRSLMHRPSTSTSAAATSSRTITEHRPGWFGISASKLSAGVSVADSMVERLRRRDDARAVGA